MACEILVVGEVMSHGDWQEGKAFSDGNGRLLKAMMRNAGLDPNRAHYTNVFMTTAKGGSVMSLCGPKKEGIPNVKYLKRGKYVRAEYRSHLDNLWAQVHRLQPNLILALGDAALWALTSSQSLVRERGYLHHGHAAISEYKVLPTYHPRDVQRDRTLMPVWLADLTKAARQSAFPELRVPSRELWLEPTLDDMEHFLHEYIVPAQDLSVDIENNKQFITCAGFAPTRDRAIIVPFYDSRKGGPYWSSLSEEVAAWNWVKRVLALGKNVGGQNYIYDMQNFWRRVGIPNPDANWDTMIMHHSMQPEMKKSLGFLASIYSDEVSWKGMRTETMKKED